MNRNQYNPELTFWRKIRNKSKYTNAQIAGYVGISDNNVCSYLSGALFPKDKTIKKFCELFHVDYETGKNEFIKAHKNWLEKHPDKQKQRKMPTTFWGIKIYEKGVRHKNVAKYLKINSSTLSNYFTGRLMPNDGKIRKLCEYLDTDFEEGKQEFIRLRSDYRQKHKTIAETVIKERKKNPNKSHTAYNKGIPNRTARKLDTFWQRAIYNTCLTNDTIAEIIGEKYPEKISIYSIGRIIPSEPKIRALCMLCNVDYEVGKAEFIKAHRIYNSLNKISNEPICKDYGTYWGKLKVNKQVSNNWIAKQVDSNPTTIAQYLRGDGIPPEDMIEQLCKIFEVDFKEGKAKFEEEYALRHPDKKWHPRDKSLPKPPPNRNVRTYKDNFWSELRVERGLTNANIAEKMGMKGNTPSIYNWFTGRNIPSDENIRKLCEIFGVGYVVGKQEFIKAHQKWYSWKFDKKKECKYNQHGEFGNSPNTVQIMEEATKILYGKISVDLYEEVKILILNNNFEEVIRKVYPEIELEVFSKLVQLFPIG